MQQYIQKDINHKTGEITQYYLIVTNQIQSYQQKFDINKEVKSQRTKNNSLTSLPWYSMPHISHKNFHFPLKF